MTFSSVIGRGVRVITGVFFAVVAAGAALEGALWTAISGVTLAIYATVDPRGVNQTVRGGYWLVFGLILAVTVALSLVDARSGRTG